MGAVTQPPQPVEETGGAGAIEQACTNALHADLGWALGTVLRAYARAAASAVADLPGGQRGYQILAIAARELAISQLAIASHIGVDRTVMTYLLDDLESAGLIERRADLADRRARRIVATPDGHRRLADLRTRLCEAEDLVLGGLDAEHRHEFRAQLLRLAIRADEG